MKLLRHKMFRLEGSKARKQSQESDYFRNRGERPICFSLVWNRDSNNKLKWKTMSMYSIIRFHSLETEHYIRLLKNKNNRKKKPKNKKTKKKTLKPNNGRTNQNLNKKNSNPNTNPKTQKSRTKITRKNPKTQKWKRK